MHCLERRRLVDEQQVAILFEDGVRGSRRTDADGPSREAARITSEKAHRVVRADRGVSIEGGHVAVDMVPSSRELIHGDHQLSVRETPEVTLITNRNIGRVLSVLRQVTPTFRAPVLTEMAAFKRAPYQLLIACLLSLRTKDTTTGPAARNLFLLAKTPSEMVLLTKEQIQSVIYPVGFYRNKAEIVLSVSQKLLEKYSGKVPSSMDELLAFKGVGRKTANLVLTMGYGLPGICVDTHVHRISNRWGYVCTKTPDETEIALREKLPKEYWLSYNDYLVALGQTLCHPTSPKCSQCPLENDCSQVGVIRKR